MSAAARAPAAARALDPSARFDMTCLNETWRRSDDFHYASPFILSAKICGVAAAERACYIRTTATGAAMIKGVVVEA